MSATVPHAGFLSWLLHLHNEHEVVLVVPIEPCQANVDLHLAQKTEVRLVCHFADGHYQLEIRLCSYLVVNGDSDDDLSAIHDLQSPNGGPCRWQSPTSEVGGLRPRKHWWRRINWLELLKKIESNMRTLMKQSQMLQRPQRPAYSEPLPLCKIHIIIYASIFERNVKL